MDISEISFKCLVTFADMQPLEYLLTQYAKFKGIPTVTLQHGLYVDYQGFDTVNTSNYQHHISDTFLAWGKDTKLLIERYIPNSNVEICGKPISTVSERPSKVEQTARLQYCSVIMDQNLFQDTNVLVLKLMSVYANKYGYSLNVKFHPQNNKSYYRELGIEFLENLDLKESKFVVGHTSSLLYELMGQGVKAYKYRSSHPSLSTPAEITFGSVDELEEKLKISFDFQSLFRDFVAHTGADSRYRYRDFFKRMNNTIQDSRNS